MKIPRIRPLFILAGLGVAVGIVAAFTAGRRKQAEPPFFNPAPNPFVQGIYANGIVESYLTNGENINLFPEVAGTVLKILATEGSLVKAGDPLLELDPSVQKATTEQLKAQSEAAAASLEELKSQPRREVLEVGAAQVDAARAGLRNVRDQLAKVNNSFQINPKSIAKGDLDNAQNSVKIARANLEVAVRQYELTKAGAWIYDIRNQEKQTAALTKQFESAHALLAKYTIRAPADGVVLAIKTAVGSYVSPQGVYGTYTQGFNPVVVMGGSEDYLQVRTYVDEILVHRLPSAEQLTGQMFIRGTNINVPLEFVRTQPYVTPKISLSDQRQERVDVRVLPIILKFEKPPELKVYPGQLVDVYLGEKSAQLPGRARPGAPKPEPSVVPSAPGGAP